MLVLATLTGDTLLSVLLNNDLEHNSQIGACYSGPYLGGGENLL